MNVREEKQMEKEIEIAVQQNDAQHSSKTEKGYILLDRNKNTYERRVK
jgi:hypothetical protein